MSPPVPFALFGRDRNGWDCWGLLRCVYMEQYGIELPDLGGDYSSADDHEAIAALYATGVAAWEEIADPVEGDAVWMRILGQPCHVGVVAGEGRVLHALVGCGTRLDTIDVRQWRKHRRLTCYRHRLLTQ